MNAINSHQQFKYRFPPATSLTNTNNEQSLEIHGSEINPKTSSWLNSKVNLSKIDQNILQLPKRTTFLSNRKTQENLLSRTWSSHVPFANIDKLSSTRRANTSTDNTDDKSIMVQHSTLNSTITTIKKLPTTNNFSPRSVKKQSQTNVSLARETTAIKLPALVKRTPSSITKPIPSAYIQESSRLMSNRSILHPTPIIPIYSPRRSVAFINSSQHLPVLKERMIKANLAQKASFKCKSPLPYRPDSSISRSTTAVLTSSQLQIKTYNPLKHMDVGLLLNEATRNRLKKLFQQLDTDKDGHLTYPQVQKCLPPNLPRAQETFFRVLYDITSETTFFGLQEFYATAVLIDMISQQNSYIWNSLLDDVDFNYYHDDVLELLEQFDSRYSPVTSTIHFDNLISIIMSRTSHGKYEHISKELETIVPSIKTMKFTRLEFIAFVPILIYIESCFDQGKSLFRFRENSILDSHMQKAALFI